MKDIVHLENLVEIVKFGDLEAKWQIVRSYAAKCYTVMEIISVKTLNHAICFGQSALEEKPSSKNQNFILPNHGRFSGYMNCCRGKTLFLASFLNKFWLNSSLTEFL